MIEEKIRGVMSAVFGVPVDSIGADASADTVEKWDSLGHLNLMISLESEFGVEFSDEDMADLTSLPLLVLEVERLLTH